jgi:hypothetical protein
MLSSKTGIWNSMVRPSGNRFGRIFKSGGAGDWLPCAGIAGHALESAINPGFLQPGIFSP